MDDEKTIRMRTFVLKEIYKTERDFLDTLKFLVDIFMERLQHREDDDNDKMIPRGTVVLLLANVEELLGFHQEIYTEMEKVLGTDPKFEHCLGEVFVKFKNRWEVYAPYCTNHERAQKKLNELSEIQEFQGFVLGCLLLGNYVNDVSMEGFLLTPIQRICKYPLLLRELSKKTPKEHPDYPFVMEALEVMKSVCSNVNETKRQLEQLEKLEDLQNSMANWEGSNLTDKCTRLIKQGALLKISAGNIQERHFFLFDHLLVYCKKHNSLPSRLSDVKKGDTIRKKSKRRKAVVEQKKYIFKGRISTELMEIENLEDGTADFHSCGYTVTNGWKILNAAKNKWFVLLAKDKEEKDAWFNEFIMEREKRRSKANVDQRDNIDVLHSKGKRLYYKVTHQGLIKDRKQKLRTYPKSMYGNDFVNYLVENKEAPTVDEAVMLAQALLDCGIIHHVHDRHHFKNEAILFRFRYDDGTFKARGESQDLLAKGIRLYCRVHCLFNPIIRDKDRMLKNYKQVVEAKALIDWLIEQGDCQTRDEVCNLGQSWCESNILHHVLDRQDFKDDSSLFRFWPDEEHSDSSSKIRDLIKKSSNKHEFKFEKAYKTKTVLLMNLPDDKPLSIGFEASYVEQHSATIVTAIIRGSQAHVQGLQPGNIILAINNDLLLSCTSQDEYQQILNHNLKKYKLICLTVKADDEVQVEIPITKEGMGFQIRSSSPCVVHAVTKGGMAMIAGLVKGQAIIRVNGKDVANEPHDEVAAAIRDGCSITASSNADKQKDLNENTIAPPEPTNNGLAVPTSIRRTKSDRRKLLGKAIGLKAPVEKEKQEPKTPTKRNGQPCLQLLVGNRHLERTAIYDFDNVNGVRTRVVEKMMESPSIFDISAQLLEVFIAEDKRVLEDVQALENVASLIVENRRDVFERRRALRFDVIHDRLENYKRFKRHLSSYLWPSYKEALHKPGTPSAKDFCPTNCHVNTMKVSHAAEKFNLRGLGVMDKHTESQATEITKQIEMVHTTNVITCMGAPSQRSRGREGHGLMAVLRGVEGNMELMDSIRRLMVGLDQALIELKQGQDQLLEILSGDSNRNSVQSIRFSTISKESGISLLPTSPPAIHLEQDDKSPKRARSDAISGDNNIPNVVINQNESDNHIVLPSNGAILSPMIEVSEKADSGQGEEDGETKNDFPSELPPQPILNVSDVTGNESECDSGIHSTRGSMIENEKQNNNLSIFNFPPPPPIEDLPPPPPPDELTEMSETPNAGAMKTTESTDDLLSPESPRNLGASMANSASAPCLSTPPNTPISPVKMRPARGRPNTKNIFSTDKDRISLISMTESTCSSDGMDSINFMDLVLSADALDKLQGTSEHFFGKIRNIVDLVKGEAVQKVFFETKEITPDISFERIIEELYARTREDEIKNRLALCDDATQFSGVLKDVMSFVKTQVSKIRTQLVIVVLLNEDPKLVSRRDKVFSQALISVISCFSTQLRCALMGSLNNMTAYGVRSEDASKKWLEQATSIGSLAMFQSMLNPNMPEECAMLEDSYVGIYDLERVSFHFKAITGEVGDVEPNGFSTNLYDQLGEAIHTDVNGVGYTVEGNRSALKVNFHLDKHIFIKLPPRLQAGGGVKVVPVIFNHGLENVGELLYKQGVSMHDFINSVNERALEKTYDYYKRFRAFHLDRSKLPRDTEARAVMIDRLSRPLNALDEVMQHMESHVKPRSNRPDLSKSGCGILTLAAEFCHRLAGSHIISCNNGVHRCTTAAALEQSLVLARCHGLPPKCLTAASNAFKQEGARVSNISKNHKVREQIIPSAPRLFQTNLTKMDDAN